MKKKAALKTALIVLLIGLIVAIYFYKDSFSNISLSGATTADIHTFVQDNGEIQVYFCPQEDCEQALVQFLQSAQHTIHCAMYEFDLKAAQEVILEKQQQPEIEVQICLPEIIFLILLLMVKTYL